MSKTDALPRINASREYRGVVARLYRGIPQPVHIAEFTVADRPVNTLRARFGTALCGVMVSDYPESGGQSKPGNATCRRCQGKWRKLQKERT